MNFIYKIHWVLMIFPRVSPTFAVNCGKHFQGCVYFGVSFYLTSYGLEWLHVLQLRPRASIFGDPPPSSLLIGRLLTYHKTSMHVRTSERWICGGEKSWHQTKKTLKTLPAVHRETTRVDYQDSMNLLDQGHKARKFHLH